MPEEIAVQTDPPKVDTGVQVEEDDSTRPVSPPRRVATSKSLTVAQQTVEERPATQSSRPQTSQKPPRTASQINSRLPSPRKPQTAASSVRAPEEAQTLRPATQPPVLPVQSPDRGGNILYIHQGHQMMNPRGTDNEVTPMVYNFNADPRLRTWQRLEAIRLHKMGLSSKFSRRYNVARSSDFVPVGMNISQPQPGSYLPPLLQASADFYTDGLKKKNDMAPFRTFQKPICGAFFSRETENRKLKHGIPPVDVLKWRSFHDRTGGLLL